MNFFVTGEGIPPIVNQSIKSDVKSSQLPVETKDSFESLLSKSLFSAFLPAAKQENQLKEIEKPSFNLLNNELSKEDLEEILFLEVTMLNSLETKEMPAEYFQVLEELVALTSQISNSTQPFAFSEEEADVQNRFSSLTERVLVFIRKYIQTEGAEEENHAQPTKQKAELKELMDLIGKKLDKAGTAENKTAKMDFGAAVPSFTQMMETAPNAAVTMNMLHLPKQTTIQWVIDTTSDEVAREQLLQKLEAVLSKTQSRVVGGNQSMTIRLNPEHLGTLHIKLQETHTGLVAKLVVHSKAAASLLENSLTSLKQNLIQSNINFDKVDVVYLDQEEKFTQQNREFNEDRRNHHSSRKNDNKEETNQSFEEMLLEELETNILVGE